jgi:hypothetical protein
MSAERGWQVREGLVMRSGNHEDVAIVDRLDVHEGNRLAILVADGHLGSALHDVAEYAVRHGLGSQGLSWTVS